jgi:putative ABC transport system permease protein
VQSSSPGYYFLAKNVARLKTPEKMSFFSRRSRVDSYLGEQKLSNALRHTDTAYWEILDFNFIAGQAFSKAQYDRGASVAVISETTAREFFQTGEPIGQSITVDGLKYQVIGVVEDVSKNEDAAYADIWVPSTTKRNTRYQDSYMGGWSALLYHSNSDGLKLIQSEFVHLLQNDVVVKDPKRQGKVVAAADTPLERLARKFNNSEDYDSGKASFLAMVGALTLCFMLLPSINLINLNISRIMERSSEIGVRKAYGASRGQLVVQFVVENILVTLFGGLLGLALSVLAIIQLKGFGQFSNMALSFSLHTLFYGVVLVFVFGLLSGAYPAYRMSKMDPVNALKGAM